MLTNTQIRALSRDHLTRVVHNMDPHDAISLLIEHLVADYDIDQDAILEDIVDYEGGDLDSVSEYLIGFGLSPSTVDQLLG
jgi:hypothetical protein